MREPRAGRKLVATVTRFWVAEHHNMPSVACTSPAVLIAHLAAVTSSIRVGSGGVMLPNHAPLVVAEQFAMLEGLYPGRIDLGIGRAPGTDQRTAAVLRRSSDPQGVDDFPHDFLDLMGLLGDPRTTTGLWNQFRATPAATTSPEIFLLGSSGYSAQLAGHLGLPFAFAHFINSHGGDGVTRAYRQQYRASARRPQPRAMVCAFVVCAERSEHAERLAQSIDLRRLQMALGIDSPIPTLAEAETREYSAQERAYIAQQRVRAVIGNPTQVRQQLEDLRERYETDELMLLTITGDYKSRLESYELIAQSCELI